MAQHGYLGDKHGSEYDPKYDDDRDDRERGWREREWRGGSDRNFMFEDRGRYDRDRARDRDDNRGFFSRMSDEARSWFSDDDDDRRERGTRDTSDADEWFGGRSQCVSAHPDDHYRNWRDQQMQALDRDYQEYCREREQQFHQDFSSWRQNRQTTRGSNGELELTQGQERSDGPQATVDPDSAATLGSTGETTSQRKR